MPVCTLQAVFALWQYVAVLSQTVQSQIVDKMRQNIAICRPCPAESDNSVASRLCKGPVATVPNGTGDLARAETRAPSR